MTIKTAYAVVQCSDLATPDAKCWAKNGISDVKPQSEGMFEITFEQNFFNKIPAVQVTAMFNGYQGSTLAPINNPSIPVGYSPANQLVYTCILWTTEKACQIRVAFQTEHSWNWTSFSITATGTGE